MALEVALRGAATQGVDTRMLDLRDYDLVFYGTVPEEGYPPDVFKLREELKAAQSSQCHGVYQIGLV